MQAAQSDPPFLQSVSNYLKIILSQGLHERLRLLKHILNNLTKKQSAKPLEFIEDIDHFPTEQPKSRSALLTLSPDAWLIALSQYPNIKLFNFYGLTYEIVRALNLSGYKVDIVILSAEFTPLKHYDLFIGHGGRCRTTLDALPADVPVFQYVSGAHWVAFNEESEARYERYAASRGISKPRSFKRDLSPILEGENYLADMADILLAMNCPRMVKTFGNLKEKFFFTGFGAYPDQALRISAELRDYEAGRKGFIYVAGSGGNIQKGLDVLLEAFEKTPHLHLYIYCRVEPEILNHYRVELELPNIHYIYHLKSTAFGNALNVILRKINFTVHAPINSGMGTAFMGSLAHGFIPVGYIDLPPHGDSSVTVEDWSVDSITACITRASEKSAGWCRQAAESATKLHEEICGTTSLRTQFEAVFSDSHITALKNSKEERKLEL